MVIYIKEILNFSLRHVFMKFLMKFQGKWVNLISRWLSINFEPRPPFAWENWKRRALFLRLGVPFTLMHYETVSFPKRQLKADEFDKAGFAFQCGQKKKTVFFENDGVAIIMWFPSPSFLKKKSPKWTVNVAFSYFSRHIVDGKEMIRFQSENIFSKFLWRSVNYKAHWIKTFYFQMALFEVCGSPNKKLTITK